MIHSRSLNLKRQTLLTFSYQSFSLVLALSAVPLAIRYIGKAEYGIWVTLTSVAAWLPSFDFGMGHGMKNRVAESLAGNDHERARVYVSTNYFLSGIILFAMFLVVTACSYMLNLQVLFNTEKYSNDDLRTSLFLAAGLIIGNLFLSLVNSVAAAWQKASHSDLGQLIMNLIWVPILYIASRNGQGSLNDIIVMSGGAGIAGVLIVNAVFFSRHPDMLPRFRFIQLDKSRDLFVFGMKFFLIQLSALVIFSTDNMIITQILGPSYVTEYSVVYKLFSVMTIGYSLFSANLWPAYTEAYTKNDFTWIRSMLRNMNLLLIPITIAVAILVLFSGYLIGKWIGPDFHTSSLLRICMGAYIIVYIWNLIYGHFLNGIGKIERFVVASLVAAILNVPFSILFAKTFGLGNAGVILGTIVSLLIISFASWSQTRKILLSFPVFQKGTQR